MSEKIDILLVEDDPDDIELLQESFHDNSVPAQFSVVTQGDKVIGFLNKCTRYPDVIILDLNLPKMHGREVLAELKNTEALREIPVIILTTSSAAIDKDYCISLGASQYLVKPNFMEEYTQVVKIICGVTVRVKNEE